jgi:hypothetical protein
LHLAVVMFEFFYVFIEVENRCLDFYIQNYLKEISKETCTYKYILAEHHFWCLALIHLNVNELYLKMLFRARV